MIESIEWVTKPNGEKYLAVLFSWRYGKMLWFSEDEVEVITQYYNSRDESRMIEVLESIGE